MSSQPEPNQKKLILSTTEVSKLLLSKGRRKINESLISNTGIKTFNNIDLTDLTSQINLKLSKEGNDNTNNMTILAEQSISKPLPDKSLFYKPKNILDRSGIFGVEKFNGKDNGNILSKLEKSQLNINLEVPEHPEQVLDSKIKKKIISLDSNEIVYEKNNIKMDEILSQYFPYELDNNFENTYKVKNFLVIFYFIIEKTTFVLLRKLDKKLTPMYFWNREEDAKKFGINYSQITTPGLYFKSYENFLEDFRQKEKNKVLVDKLKKELNKQKIEYEQNIKNIKEQYEKIIKELNDKINEYENDNELKNNKIEELNENIQIINDEMNKLKLINEQLIKENNNLKNKFMDSNEEMESEEVDNSFPKLDDYNIDNDEDDKIDNIKNIDKMKTYGERKKFYENYNTDNSSIKNNFMISIKDYPNKKEKENNFNKNNNNSDTIKNKYKSEDIKYKNKFKESESSNFKHNESQENSSEY